MNETPDTIPNPDLAVGDGNKQRWNQPAHRRHGFHNAHQLFRRALMIRSRRQLLLVQDEDADLAALPAVETLTQRPEFSALVCAKGNRVLLSRHAPDFAPTQPHSIQSITKLFMHLIAGKLIGEGRLDPGQTVEHYLPEIGSGYRGAIIQDVLDMNVMNDFSEDYSDPNADCYAEEIALGWRLPAEGAPETTLHEFVTNVSGSDLTNREMTINYCSANTDLLSLICDRLMPGSLPTLIADIVDAAGLEGAFHISLSPEGLPAFSGGGCMSATDLARFGLLLERLIGGYSDAQVGNAGFSQAALQRTTKTLKPPRDHVSYADQLMTNGKWVGHAGYGGQFLMVNTETGMVCSYLSVLENEAGYCEAYMIETINLLETIAGHRPAAD